MFAKKEVLVLFSGGKDSFLTTCLLIEQGFKVLMVTFENGAGLEGSNANHGAQRIIEKYGEERVEYLGLYFTAGIWREFLLPFLNMKPSEILSEYGELTSSQFNCLTCRSAMYAATIMIAKEHDVVYVADGARSVQGFVIELPCMAQRFREFFEEFSIDLMFPVLSLESDWRLKNLLLSRGFIPKTLEPQCLLGAPIFDIPDCEIQEAVVKYFDKVVAPKAREILADGQFIIKKGGELI